MTNMQLSSDVLQGLINSGVDEFILCAGARNSPFVHLLDENKDLKVYSFFEERSASFFALGRIALTRKPVAIVTTSGTAVAEVLPAAVEATYSSLPLVIVTADRPKSYRGKGAPQTIEQVGIFSSYVEVVFDLDIQQSDFNLKNVSWKMPIHINVCFEEPLLDGPCVKLESIPAARASRNYENHLVKELEVFLANSKPLVLLGSLPEKSHKVVLKFLKSYGAPVYAEGISSLRGHQDLNSILIKSGEQMIEKLFKAGVCNSVLRIGGVPTARIWRDLEAKYKKLPVFSVSYNQFTGLSRDVKHSSTLRILEKIKVPMNVMGAADLLAWDQGQALKIKQLLEKHPQSEQALVHNLSKLMKNQWVYLGNSMPIREWDSFADTESSPIRLAANRGANGIDGQISTFLGWSHPDYENWCLVGDLTAMYDLSSLWATSQVKAEKFRIVIINNSGGQIFSRMFNKDIFINRHNIVFDSWAKMWNWSYQRWNSIPADFSFANHQIIEVCPDSQQTKDFWKDLDKLWKE